VETNLQNKPAPKGGKKSPPVFVEECRSKRPTLIS